LIAPEVHEGIDVIGALFQRYYTLLTASSWSFLVPTMEGDWKAIFCQPWIRSAWVD
jgi:hypothetical protein